jgi:hypothetical protein
MAEEITGADTSVQDTSAAQDTDAAKEATPQKTDAEPQDTSLMADGDKDAEPKDDSLMADDKEKEGDEAKDDGDKKADDAPEKYEAFTLQEGYEMSPEQFDSFSTFAKELNLNQETAQKLVDYHAGLEKSRAEANQQSVVEGRKEDQAALREQYGDKYPEVTAIAKKAIQAYMPKELKETFINAGFDFNPHIVTMFYNIGKTISEDSYVEGGNKATKTENFGKYSDILEQNPMLGKR